MAFALGERPVTADAIADAIRGERTAAARLRVFDVFPLPDGRRSLAFRLTFQADDAPHGRRGERDSHRSPAASARRSLTLRGPNKMSDSVADRLTQLEAAVRRATEAVARLRERTTAATRQPPSGGRAQAGARQIDASCATSQARLGAPS